MRFDRRNAVKTAVAGVIGWLAGGKAHDEPVGEAGGVERSVKADDGLLLVFRDGTKVRLRDTTPRGQQGKVGTVTILVSGASSCDRMAFFNGTGGPVVVNVVQYEGE